MRGLPRFLARTGFDLACVCEQAARYRAVRDRYIRHARVLCQLLEQTAQAYRVRLSVGALPVHQLFNPRQSDRGCGMCNRVPIVDLKQALSDAIEELERQWSYYRRVYEEAMK